MLAEFIKGFTTQVSGRFAITVFAPAFVFWAFAVGTVVWDAQIGLKDIDAAVDYYKNLHTMPQVAVLLAIILLASASGLIAEMMNAPLIRFLEGYWPTQLGFLWDRMVCRQNAKYSDMQKRYVALLAKGKNCTQRENVEKLSIRQRFYYFPNEHLRMPTTLGNILRSAEERPLRRYGLDSVICWPQFWLVLPESTRSEIASARSRLDQFATIWLLAFVYLVWTVILLVWTTVGMNWGNTLLALVPILPGILGTWVAHLQVLENARIYGTLFVAAYHVHRLALYEAFRWPLPKNPSEEVSSGLELTKYIASGLASKEPEFVNSFD